MSDSAEKPSRFRALVVRLGLTALALAAWAYVARGSLGTIARSLGRLDPLALVAGIGFLLVGFVLGTLRWRLVLRAYGAARLPAFGAMLRVLLVGHFYNTFIPGNVGGDALRGHVTRGSLPSAGAYVAVFIERGFGLAGLLLLASATALVRPVPGMTALPVIASLGLVAAIGAAFAPVLARRLGHLFPGKLGELLSTMPSVARPALLAPVLLLSVGIQFVAALVGHVALVSLVPEVTLAESVVLVPLALVALYFPTIAGLGARELAFVVLFRSVGVAEADATATSFAFLGVQLAVAAFGGLLMAVRGVDLGTSDPGE